MLIVAHRGTSLISRIIAWVRPPYSHCELWFPGRTWSGWQQGHAAKTGAAGTVISADPVGVVARNIPVTRPSGSGTVVDFFEFSHPLNAGECTDAWRRATALIDMRYDYWMLAFGFTAKAAENDWSRKRAICSGLVQRVCSSIGRPLLARVAPDAASPSDLMRSPVLQWTRSQVLA